MSCSVNIRESPISDTKMDISDPTNSIGSTAVSPEIDMIGSADACNRNSIDETYLHVCDISILASGKKNDDSLCVEAETSSEIRVKPTLNENGEIQRCSENQTGSKPDNRTQKLVLDNRYVEGACRPALLNLSEKHMSSLTVANRHPLMSPTSTDSESENSCLMQSGFSLKLQNFPDLIPNEERHMTRAKDIQRDYKRPSCDIRAVINKAEQSASAAPANTLNCNKVLNKLSVLRASAHSPDLLSSGSEADASLYHAAVGANLQSVVLISNANNTTNASCVHGRVSKRNGVIPPAGSEDISSLDSISNHSFDDDEDLEHNLASLSPSSSIIDGLDDDDDECEGPEIDDDFVEATTPTNTRGEDILPQYTAEEERRDSRNWQKITLPDGSTREIDMKVIEPYKRVLSHGGYLKAGGQNAIVIFCACHLPDRSRTDYHYVMDNLFLYVVKTLEQLVTEDYVLIYLHGGTSRRNVPSFPWLKKCYQLLDRRLRKSLKNMYLVHPTFWIKSIVWMARPFVSAKFWRKLIYVKSLQELGTHVAVEKAAIPDKVKQYDAKYN